MFCQQCEQTAKGQACTVIGVCGKKEEVAALQDLLIHATQGLCQYSHAARGKGFTDSATALFTAEAIFSTLTNVNFVPEDFAVRIRRAVELREAMKEKSGANFTNAAATFTPATDLDGLIKQGQAVGLNTEENEDLRSVKHIILFGLKGVAAYVDHAKILGQESPEVAAYIDKAMSEILRDDIGLDELVPLALECGEANLKAMEILNIGNTGTYGHPVPTEVPLGVKKGKALLVSGHDLKDLDLILQQTAGKGITVYSHGEILPCHGYPELKKHAHFHGHFGTAWQNQKKEFAEFPGAIVMTTNCIQDPKAYTENIFTSGLVGWPGVQHLENGDFSPAINRALAMDGFPEDTEAGSVMVGFGHNAVLGVADKIIEAVKNKDIRHFFLVGGCDGAKTGRNYYTEMAEKIPSDCIVMTLACGKFRFFDKDLGDIGGIPRLLDIGQCNDAYSAVQIAVALANAFDCGVNDLPLSFILSWYEQKAVAILLTLFHLGIKDIRLGPSLPAFITPNVLNVLVENFNVMPISTVDEDLKAILG